MPTHKYIGSQVFKCIDVLDENCGIIGKLNNRINDIISVSGIGYILSDSFDMGGTSHNVFYYPTKDNNSLGDTYNLGRFEKGNFIKHIYTCTLSNNINNIIVEYDIYMEDNPHDVTIEVCEVKHDAYSGTESTDLPALHSETISFPIGNSKGKFNFSISSITLNKTVTVRMKFIDDSHGNEQVTMACTLYGTA